MAVLGATVATLIDIAKRLDPDGKIARIAEILNQSNEVLSDMLWIEGNLPTGDRTTVRTGLPAVAFRRINEGVPRSKSIVAQLDEGAAMLEGFAEVDRKLAILSGDIAQYRLSESAAFFESMNQTMATNVFYGNANATPAQFTGLAPRYGALSPANGGPSSASGNIIDAGGTGSTNRSIWLVVWGDQTIRGIYPKGTKAGLFHEDATSNKASAGGDGFPVGDVLYDASGNPYMGYRDHYEWNCGLSVRDWRYAVRICNVDRTLMTKDAASGPDIIDLMTQALENVQSISMGGTKAVFYVPRNVRSFLRRQMVNHKNVFLDMEDVGGNHVMTFDGVPVRRVDALNVDEARVV
jgi:hypothetical protein